jgi:uncharacterized protein (TIGR03118 family)
MVTTEPQSERHTKAHIKRRGLVAIAAAGLLGITWAGTAGATGHRFVEHDLVSDVAGRADITDHALVNAWGMAQGPTTPIWVAANGTNKAALYTGDGVGAPVSKVPLTVRVPGDGVTGQVFNGTSGFVVSDGQGHSGPALFIFDSESGDVTGWNPAVPPPAPSTKAQRGTHVNGAIFKGLAIAQRGASTFLYAADFHNGKIDVFNSSYHLVQLGGPFVDPNLPKGYAPFNITALDGKLFVSYAVQDADREDEVAGLGKGIVDVFDTGGHFIHRLVSHGQLNAPWGMAIAPSGFGGLGGALLVGNFGDGRIHAYDAHTGAPLGTLRRPNGHAVVIDGLWALMFGNGSSAGTRSLMFSAGPNDESHGLFGSITAT